MRRLALLGLGLAACATGPSLEEAMAIYDRRAESCRVAHPFEKTSEGERGWAPGEQVYHECLRRALEEVVVPTLPYAELRVGYRALIAEESRLAQEFAAGRLSRGEYREKVDAATAELAAEWRRRSESDRRSRASAEQADQLQRQLTIIDDLVRRGRR